MQNQNRNVPWPLLAIFASFLAPILLAYWLFFSGYGQQNTVNRGTLLPTPGVLITSQAPVPKKWILAELNHTQSIPKNLHTIGNRWVALGKEQHRVQLARLVNNDTPNITTPWPELTVTTKTWKMLAQQKTVDNTPCHYFLIDPKHHAILCYSETVSPKDIDTDLRKLLKYSRSG